MIFYERFSKVKVWEPFGQDLPLSVACMALALFWIKKESIKHSVAFMFRDATPYYLQAKGQVPAKRFPDLHLRETLIENHQNWSIFGFQFSQKIFVDLLEIGKQEKSFWLRTSIYSRNLFSEKRTWAAEKNRVREKSALLEDRVRGGPPVIPFY